MPPLLLISYIRSPSSQHIQLLFVEPFLSTRNFKSRFGPQKYSILVILCFTASNGVTFANVQLSFSPSNSLTSWTRAKLKMVSFVDTHTVYHGALQRASLIAFLIAFTIFKDLSCGWIAIKIRFFSKKSIQIIQTHSNLFHPSKNFHFPNSIS